jgi:rare lipoprotein A (RlpA)-like double-psi beta-barrel protein
VYDAPIRRSSHTARDPFVPSLIFRPALRRRSTLVLATSALVAYGCMPIAYAPPVAPPAPVVYMPPTPPRVEERPEHRTMFTRASWYGPGFEGHRTATGERFSSGKMTAAAIGLPLGSRVKVTNLANGRSALVRINDCGPFRRGRKLDLSKRAARKLGIIHDGTAVVRVRVVNVPAGALACTSL